MTDWREPTRRQTRRGPSRVVALMVLAFVLTFGLTFGLAFGPGIAAARSTSTLPYPSNGVWTAAVRYLRVDRGLPIREKDESAGYVLFDYADGGKTYHGALELLASTD